MQRKTYLAVAITAIVLNVSPAAHAYFEELSYHTNQFDPQKSSRKYIRENEGESPESRSLNMYQRGLFYEKQHDYPRALNAYADAFDLTRDKDYDIKPAFTHRVAKKYIALLRKEKNVRKAKEVEAEFRTTKDVIGSRNY